MKITVKRAYIIYALILAFLAGVVILVVNIALYGETWALSKINRHFSYETDINQILDINGNVLVNSESGERIYNEDENIRAATLHLVGDRYGYISTGVQTIYNEIPDGYNFTDGIYNMLGNDLNAITSINLNVDSAANVVAYEALKGKKGAVAVYNYKTGQLLCSVSSPTYDPDNTPDNLLDSADYEAVFLDRVTKGSYTPGSIMKIVTAASAIENIPDIYSREFICGEETTTVDGKKVGLFSTGDGSVTCNGLHGKQSFQKAMNNSCNCAFAKIALELGSDRLLATAESLGFNQQLYAGRFGLTTSKFSPSSTSKRELGWAGIGQATTRVTPAHFLSIMGAIANGGEGYAPNRIGGFTTVDGEFIAEEIAVMVSINPSTAQQLAKLLRSNVTDKYGDSKFPNLQMCGKTGTAQRDNAESHSWFAGYSQRDDLPLAVVCIVEGGGSGSGIASNVSNKVMQYFLEHPESLN